MNTVFNRLGFLSISLLLVMGMTSCEKEEIAQATITVLQEYSASQGPVNQTRPIENAEVRFYVPKDGAEHLETIAITNSSGMVSFEYQYEVRVFAEVTYLGTVYPRKLVIMRLGQKASVEIVLPE